MGMLRTSSMDTNEPSLVPEWLKANGHNHSHAFQGGGNCGPVRHSSFANRAQPQPFAIGAFGERVLDRENNHHRSYPNFGRGRFAERSERDREVPSIERGRDWDWNRDRRVHEKDRYQVGGTGSGDGRFKGHGFSRSSARPDVERFENVEKKFTSWSTPSHAQRSTFDRKLTPRDVPTPNPGLLGSKKVADNIDNLTHAEKDSAELRSPRVSSCASVPKMSEALVHISSPPQGLVSRKQIKATDVKTNPPAGSLLPYRSPAPSNGSKPAPGKLLVLKAGKEAPLPPTTLKTGTPASLPNGNLPTKQLVDRRSLPISTATTGNCKPPREGLAVHEERKPLVLSQNRSDFFNAIRKKAAANGENRNPEDNTRAVERDENKQDSQHDTPPVKVVATEATVDDVVKQPAESNGVTYQHQFSGKQFSSEEEENAFLISLGWEPAAEDEALTEEEIISFVQTHVRCLSSSPSLLSREKIRNALYYLSLGSPSSSGSDSEDDSRVQSS